jgi:hypothetical protein
MATMFARCYATPAICQGGGQVVTLPDTYHLCHNLSQEKWFEIKYSFVKQGVKPIYAASYYGTLQKSCQQTYTK